MQGTLGRAGGPQVPRLDGSPHPGQATLISPSVRKLTHSVMELGLAPQQSLYQQDGLGKLRHRGHLLHLQVPPPSARGSWAVGQWVPLASSALVLTEPPLPPQALIRAARCSPSPSRRCRPSRCPTSSRSRRTPTS